MINAREAKERVRAHKSCASLHLVSDDKDINAECVEGMISGVIRQVASDGLSSVEVVLSSVKPITEVLDINDIRFMLLAYGYVTKLSEEVVGRAEGIVGEHIVSLEIGW